MRICDPIQLAMRSNLGFAYVVDIVSQALARVYFDEKLDQLRPLGLRGAFEIWNLYQRTAAVEQDKKQEAMQLINVIATAIGVDSNALYYAFCEIAEDPRTIFLIEAYP